MPMDELRESLEKLSDPAAKKALILSALKNASWKVRKSAIYALADTNAFDNTERLTLLHERLEDDDAKFVRVTAFFVLSRYDEGLMPAVLTGLRDTFWAIRNLAIDRLASADTFDNTERLELLNEHLENDDSGSVRVAAFEALSRLSDTPTDVIQAGLANDCFRVRKFAVKALNTSTNFSDIERLTLLSELLEKEDDSDVWSDAFEALSQHGCDVRTAILVGLINPNWVIRQLSVEALNACEAFNDTESQTLLCMLLEKESNKIVWDDAFDVMTQHGGDARTAILAGLKNTSGQQISAALKALDKADAFDETERLALLYERVKKELNDVVWATAFEVLSRHGGDTKSAILAGLASVAPRVRLEATNALGTSHGIDYAQRLPLLTEILKDECRKDIWAAAFKILSQHGGNVRDAILAGLKSSSSEVRQLAIEETDTDHSWFDKILSHCRDSDKYVRQTALEKLVYFHDPRAFAELVASTYDTDSEIRELASTLLDDRQLPALRSIATTEDIHALVGQLKKKIQRVNDWGTAFTSTMLRQQTKIIRLAEGLGQTALDRELQEIILEISYLPIASRHPHGEEITQALILHEMGHHLYDNIRTPGFRSVLGQIRAEGLDELFAILQDERLERRLRARWPQFQPAIDRLNRYAFAENTIRVSQSTYAAALKITPQQLADEVQTGQRPGQWLGFEDEHGEPQIDMRISELMPLPGVVTAEQAFLWCLIGGFDPRLYNDKRLIDVLSEIPADLKKQDHPGLLRIARRLQPLLDAIDQNLETKAINGQEKRGARAHREAIAALNKSVENLLSRLRALGFSHQARATSLPPKPDIPGPVRRHVIRTRPQRNSSSQGLPGQGLNLGDATEFDQLTITPQHSFDSEAHARLVGSIRRHVRGLRSHFERLGWATVEEGGRRQGRRLDLARAQQLPHTGNPNVLVQRYEAEQASAYVGILIDRSISMDGEKIELAKSFAALITESAKGIRGISGDVGAFDDDTYYPLGTLRRCAVSSLGAGGGNNDAGGLARAAERALASGKRHKLLVMISDGSPTDCSVEALRDLVSRLQRVHGIVLVQVAVDEIEHEAFPEFVDLTAYDFHEAVARFGQMVRKHASHWR